MAVLRRADRAGRRRHRRSRDDAALRDALARIAALRGDISNARRRHRARGALPHLPGRRAGSASREHDAQARDAGWPRPRARRRRRRRRPRCSRSSRSRRRRCSRASRSGCARADRWKQVIALVGYVRRLYAPKQARAHRSELVDGRWIDRSRYDGELVLGAVVRAGRGRRRGCAALLERRRGRARRSRSSWSCRRARRDDRSATRPRVHRGARRARARPARRARSRCRCSRTERRARTTRCRQRGDGRLERDRAARPAPRDGRARRPGALPQLRARAAVGARGHLLLLRARREQDPDDERMFVLGDVRSRPAAEGHDAELFAPIFERAFQEAARTLRLNLGIRDPRRRAALEPRGDAHGAPGAARRGHRAAPGAQLLSNIRHLGVEKTDRAAEAAQRRAAASDAAARDRGRRLGRGVEPARADLAQAAPRSRWCRRRRTSARSPRRAGAGSSTRTRSSAC